VHVYCENVYSERKTIFRIQTHQTLSIQQQTMPATVHSTGALTLTNVTLLSNGKRLKGSRLRTITM